MQIQVKHIPVSVVSTETANLIWCKIFLVGVGGAPIGLEPNRVSKP